MEDKKLDSATSSTIESKFRCMYTHYKNSPHLQLLFNRVSCTVQSILFITLVCNTCVEYLFPTLVISILYMTVVCIPINFNHRQNDRGCTFITYLLDGGISALIMLSFYLGIIAALTNASLYYI